MKDKNVFKRVFNRVINKAVVMAFIIICLEISFGIRPFEIRTLGIKPFNIEPFSINVMAASNSEEIAGSGKRVIFMDEANLISSSEKNEVMEVMRLVAEDANVIFVTNNLNIYSSGEGLAKNTCEKYFGTSKTDPVVVFAINMYCREIYMYCTGNTVTPIITNGEALSITDNTYQYATDGDYKGCAVEAFTEAHTLLTGGEIKRPMKMISNIFLGIIIGFSVTYGYMLMTRASKRKAALKEIKKPDNGIKISTDDVLIKSYVYTETEGSSGGGSSGGGGGGGGGGGSSSGGGHSF